jgi:hypothetical protein
MPRPRKPKSERVIPVAVYMPPPMRQELQRIADDDRRSLSVMALLLIEEGIKSRKR